MERLLMKGNHSLLKRVVTIHKLNRRSAVDLAHDIHGKKPSEGGDPPVVVLHGLLGSKRNWKSISHNIAAKTNRSVVAADLRNHGDSPHAASHTYIDLASDVSQLFTTLSISKAAVIGHSMGGRTAMVFALTEPSKVTKLIIVDVSPIPNKAGLLSVFPALIEVMRSVDFTGITDVRQARDKAKGIIVASGILRAEHAYFILMNIGSRPDKSIGWLYNNDVLKEYFPSIASFPTEMQGKQYDGPTLFIGGGHSDFLPPSDLDAIKQYFPKAELTYVPGVGHNVHAENSPAFLKLVTKFLSPGKT